MNVILGKMCILWRTKESIWGGDGIKIEAIIAKLIMSTINGTINGTINATFNGTINGSGTINGTVMRAINESIISEMTSSSPEETTNTFPSTPNQNHGEIF